MRASNRGFSLMELIVVVAIIGILAAVGFPAYRGYVPTARQASAQQVLLTIAAAQEQYRFDALTYADALDDLSDVSTASVDDYYTVTLSDVTATTFTVTATPKGSQATAGMATLTLNQSGTRTPSTVW